MTGLVLAAVLYVGMLAAVAVVAGLICLVERVRDEMRGDNE